MKRFFLIFIVISVFLLSCDESDNLEISENLISRENAPTNYSTKVLIEYLKGTWCGYSARVDYTLDKVESTSNNIIGVEVHYSDNLVTRYASFMRQEYSIQSFPTGLINRSIFWNESQSQLDIYLRETAKLGLAIRSIKEGSSLKIKVKVGFAEDIPEDLRLVVYLTEDGILEDQRNAYNEDINSPLFGAGNPIIDFEQNRVLRLALTDFLGNDIPNISVFKRNIYTADFEGDISEYDFNNLNIVAFVINAEDYRNVYNAQTVKAGNSINFD